MLVLSLKSEKVLRFTKFTHAYLRKTSTRVTCLFSVDVGDCGWVCGEEIFSCVSYGFQRLGLDPRARGGVDPGTFRLPSRGSSSINSTQRGDYRSMSISQSRLGICLGNLDLGVWTRQTSTGGIWWCRSRKFGKGLNDKLLRVKCKSSGTDIFFRVANFFTCQWHVWRTNKSTPQRIIR